MFKTRFPACVAILVVWFASACGSGGTAPAVPAAPPTSAPPGDLVLYVAQSQANRVDAYRLGTDGLPQGRPFSSMAVTNPRRLVFDDGVLFVAGSDQVVSAVVDDEGGLPDTPTSSSFVLAGVNNLEMVVAFDHLYVASAGTNSINAYSIDDQGRLSDTPSSTASGLLVSDYVTIALDGRFLYAGTRDRAQIDTFLIGIDGELPSEPENQEPETFVILPDDIFIRDGILYVASGNDANIRAYIIRENGLLGEEEDAETQPEDFYADLIVDDDFIYAAAFNAGHIAVYALDPLSGLPPREPPVFTTRIDTEAFPLGMTLNGGILYVSQGGHGRVDAYALRPSGLPPEFPTGSTTPIRDSFPVDTAVARIR